MLKLVFILILSFSSFISLQAQSASEKDSAAVIRIDGTIGPDSKTYFDRALEKAIEQNFQFLIIELDTPGGLLSTTQEMVQVMLNSSYPIIVYVNPEGANAGSAGTFITMAAHIAAMAPSTTIGAASPVTMGGSSPPDTVMQKKLFNFTENFIQNIAEKRGRNVDWAISAVREGKALTADEAVEKNVIDLIATDTDDLLRQLNGETVAGTELSTNDIKTVFIERSLAEKFFSIILRPEVILILTMISIYGIVGEITNPGTIIPGMAGVISLIILLYGVSALPLNIAGFLMIGLAVVLFILEVFTSTFGVLTIGGAVAFFLGAMMVFQEMPDNMQISFYWLVPATVLTVLFFGLIATAGIKAQFGRKVSGMESWIGRKARVVDDIDQDSGRVEISGEYWNARSSVPVKAGNWCEIQSVEGLTLHVKPYSNNQEQNNGT